MASRVVYLSPTGTDVNNTGLSPNRPLRSLQAALSKFENLPVPSPGDQWRILSTGGVFDVSPGFEVFLPQYNFCPIVIQCPLVSAQSGTVSSMSFVEPFGPGQAKFAFAFQSAGIVSSAVDDLFGKTITWITALDGLRHRVKVMGNTNGPNELVLNDFIPNAAVGDSWSLDEPGCTFQFSGPVKLSGQGTAPDGNTEINLLCFGCKYLGTTPAFKLEIGAGLSMGCWLCTTELGGGQLHLHDGARMICQNFSNIVPDLIQPLEGTCGSFVSSTGPTSGPGGVSILVEGVSRLITSCCYRALGRIELRQEGIFAANIQMLDGRGVRGSIGSQIVVAGGGVGLQLAGLKRPMKIRNSAAYPAIPGRNALHATAATNVVIFGDLDISDMEGDGITVGPGCLLDLKTTGDVFTGGFISTKLTGAGNGGSGVTLGPLAVLNGAVGAVALNTLTGAGGAVTGSTGSATWAAVDAGGGIIVGAAVPAI